MYVYMIICTSFSFISLITIDIFWYQILKYSAFINDGLIIIPYFTSSIPFLNSKMFV